MRKFTGLLKKDLINILVEEFDYNESEVTKQELTAKELKELILKEDAKEEDSLSKVIVKPQEKRIVKREDECTIMSGVMGEVFYTSPSGQMWNFREFGQTDVMSVNELVRIRNTYPRYLDEYWFIILDDDVVKFLGLTDKYEHIIRDKEVLDEIFHMSADRLEEALERFSKGMQELIAAEAQIRYNKRELSDLNKIRIIQDKLNIILDIKNM